MCPGCSGDGEKDKAAGLDKAGGAEEAGGFTGNTLLLLGERRGSESRGAGCVCSLGE